MYNIYINCYHEYFYGSIFDISFTEENITICDVFMAGGNKVNTFSYLDRMSQAEYFVDNTIESDPKLNTIKYYNCISDILGKNLNLNENEELFIIPNNLPITTGINYSCFKWKPTNRITFNLLFEDDNEDINVYTTNFKKLKQFAKIRNNTPEGVEYIKSIRTLDDYKSGCIIELNIENDKMDIIKVVKDKTIPTTIRGIEKILHIKKENITIEDIIGLKN
tara:strand:- start:500 stop:1162 length:663 start_codon:yes stop_codon:yes gene_type:complete